MASRFALHPLLFATEFQNILYDLEAISVKIVYASARSRYYGLFQILHDLLLLILYQLLFLKLIAQFIDEYVVIKHL